MWRMTKPTGVGSVTEHGRSQADSGGAIPTPTLQFSPVPLRDVGSFIKIHHYSHTYPGGGDYCFKLDMNGKLAGAAMFGYMAGNPKGMCVLRGIDDAVFYRELMRLVLLDEVPKMSETRFVAWCLRWLRANTNLVAVISFADPHFGHSGTIYKAGNWIYTGLQKPDRDRLIINGTEVHPRMCVNRYGTSSVPKLREMGLTVETEYREPKHRFVYILQPKLRSLLKYDCAR